MSKCVVCKKEIAKNHSYYEVGGGIFVYILCRKCGVKATANIKEIELIKPKTKVVV